MNYLVLTMLALFATQLQAQQEMPLIGEIEAKGWTVIADEQGDLNGDEQAERVLVLDTGEKNDAGTARQLYIFQWTSVENEEGEMTEDWQLWQESATAVLPGQEKESDADADILSGLTVEEGILTVSHQGENSRAAWTYAHQYRLMDEEFQLVELETTEHIKCEKRVIFHFKLTSGLASCTREDESCSSETANNNGTARMDFMKKAESLPNMAEYTPGEEEMTVMGLDEKVRF